MRDPVEALRHWFRVLKPGGHLVCVVPDEDLYEQGVFPSTFNSDHKWTFSLWKAASWSAKSVNVVDLIKALGEQAQPVRLELLATEIEEEKRRVLATVAWGAVAVLVGCFTLAFAAVFITVLFWEIGRAHV